MDLKTIIEKVFHIYELRRSVYGDPIQEHDLNMLYNNTYEIFQNLVNSSSKEEIDAAINYVNDRIGAYKLKIETISNNMITLKLDILEFESYKGTLENALNEHKVKIKGGIYE